MTAAIAARMAFIAELELPIALARGHIHAAR